MMLPKLAAGALCLALMAGPAPAAVVFDFYERNGNVEGEFQGSLNLTNAVVGCSECGTFPAVINPLEGRVINGLVWDGVPGNTEANTRSYLATGPLSFGTEGTTSTPQANRAGAVFGVRVFGGNVEVLVSRDFYNSGNPLSGSLNFLSTSFDVLGITAGSYVYTLVGSNDTVTLNFISRPSAIPLPATLPLLIGGIGAAIALTRRRKASPAA